MKRTLLWMALGAASIEFGHRYRRQLAHLCQDYYVTHGNALDGEREVFARKYDFGAFTLADFKAYRMHCALNDWTLGNPTLLSTGGIKSAATVDKIYRLGAQFG